MEDRVIVRGLKPVEYEQLTRRLLDRLAQRAPVVTTKLVHDERKLRGLATGHQVDVLWEFTAANGQEHRVLFECRHYNRALTQDAVLAFKSVVDDVAAVTPDKVTSGVMVTETGYQSGARAVAETYGLVVVELRNPSAKDLASHVIAVELTVSVKVPRVTEIRFEAVDGFSKNTSVGVVDGDLQVEYENGVRERVLDLMKRGEIFPPDAPATPAHRVVRTFETPVLVLAGGEPIAKVREVSAMVFEEGMTPTTVKYGGTEWIALMARDALTGYRAWFTIDGKIHTSEA